jgi:hypothetical protein
VPAAVKIKAAWLAVCDGRLAVTAEPFGNPWKGSRENNSFPEYYAWEASLNLNPASGAKRVVCNGPLSYKGHRQVAADIATFKAALAKVNVREAFLPAISPSNVEFWIRNEHYRSGEEYIFALAEVLHESNGEKPGAGRSAPYFFPVGFVGPVGVPPEPAGRARTWSRSRLNSKNQPSPRAKWHSQADGG